MSTIKREGMSKSETGLRWNREDGDQGPTCGIPKQIKGAKVRPRNRNVTEMSWGLCNENGTRGVSRLGLRKLAWRNKVRVLVQGYIECNIWQPHIQ